MIYIQKWLLSAHTNIEWSILMPTKVTTAGYALTVHAFGWNAYRQSFQPRHIV